MEDVWNQINLTSLSHHSNHITTTSPAITPFQGMFFQDFLPPLSGSSSNNNKDPAKYRSSVVPSYEFTVPAPGTVLSLSPCPDFQYPVSNDLVKQTPQVCSKKPSYFSHDYDVMPAHSSADFTPFSKKRDSGQNGDINLGDRRHKRMMKNRESAARSRSRRQAYTYELELEIAKLAEENAMLKKQQEKLLMTVASSDETLKQHHHQHDKVSKKHRLQRTSTWPF